MRIISFVIMVYPFDGGCGGVGYHRAPCQSERERKRGEEATKSRGTDYASGGQPSSCYVEIGSLGRVPNCGVAIIKV